MASGKKSSWISSPPKLSSPKAFQDLLFEIKPDICGTYEFLLVVGRGERRGTIAMESLTGDEPGYSSSHLDDLAVRPILVLSENVKRAFALTLDVFDFSLANCTPFSFRSSLLLLALAFDGREFVVSALLQPELVVRLDERSTETSERLLKVFLGSNGCRSKFPDR